MSWQYAELKIRRRLNSRAGIPVVRTERGVRIEFNGSGYSLDLRSDAARALAIALADALLEPTPTPEGTSNV